MVLTLECLLMDTTSAPYKAFSTYLQQQFCTENLMFWLEVQHYKSDYTNDKKELNRLAQQCMGIIYTYIQPNSCREINIPCDMRHDIIDKVKDSHYHPDLFYPACEAVLELMRANAFIPWLSQWAPDMLPSPPLSCSSPTSSAMVSSLSSPDGWNLLTSSPSSSPRPSVSSFRSTNDLFLPSSKQQQKDRQRRVGGLTYQSMLKRMKDSFFHSSKSSHPIRRSSLTWPSTSNRKK
ncbi:RGS domain-containing protein [Chlamydoabsidia padenii]|nr:RGS domain-containing protein [Chlamydoabsidia padenii]